MGLCTDIIYPSLTQSHTYTSKLSTFQISLTSFVKSLQSKLSQVSNSWEVRVASYLIVAPNGQTEGFIQILSPPVIALQSHLGFRFRNKHFLRHKNVDLISCVCPYKKRLEILLQGPDLAEGICSPQVNENRLRVAAKDKRNDGHPGHEIISYF